MVTGLLIYIVNEVSGNKSACGAVISSVGNADFYVGLFLNSHTYLVRSFQFSVRFVVCILSYFQVGFSGNRLVFSPCLQLTIRKNQANLFDCVEVIV